MNITKAARAVLPVGVVALVSSTLTPASAETTEPLIDEPVDQGIEGATVTVTERTFDLGGTLIDDHEWSADYSLDQLEGGQPVTHGRAVGASPVGLKATSGAAVSGGCRSIDISMWVGRKYHFGPTVTFYRYHHNKRWCWNPGTGVVDRLNWYDYFTDVDALWYDRGQVRNESYHYAAWGGYPKSGHKSFTQRQIENCLVHCVGVDHPWADVHAFADGAYWFNLGL
jgi:hypothetical protein